MQWLVWLGVALAAGVAEMFTLQFVFVMVAGGALLASLSAVVLPVPVQLLVFAAATVGLLVAARPPLIRYARRSAPEIATGTAALVGRDARVLTTVSERGGTVRLAGEEWTARTPPGGRVLEVGSVVRVAAIEGATAVVEPPHQDQEPTVGRRNPE